MICSLHRVYKNIGVRRVVAADKKMEPEALCFKAFWRFAYFLVIHTAGHVGSHMTGNDPVQHVFLHEAICAVCITVSRWHTVASPALRCPCKNQR